MRIPIGLLALVLMVPYVILAAFFFSGMRRDQANLHDSVLICNGSSGTAKLVQAAHALGVRVKIDASFTDHQTVLQTPAGGLSGITSIASFLDGKGAIRPSLSKGLRAALLLLAIQGLVLLYWRNLTPYSIFIVPAGLLIALSYGIPCMSCGSIGPADLAPSLCALLLVALGVVLAYQDRAPRWLIGALLAALLIAPTIQAYMLAARPLLCPLCTALAGVFSVLAYSFRLLLRAERLPGLPDGSKFRYLAACAAALAIQTGRFAVAGHNPAPRFSSESELQQLLLGKPLASLAHVPPDALQLALVTKAGCGYCEAAKGQLALSNVAYTELPACTALSEAGCFDSDKTPVAFPSVLFIDSSGVIEDVQVGWPHDAGDVLDLVERMKLWRKH